MFCTLFVIYSILVYSAQPLGISRGLGKKSKPGHAILPWPYLTLGGSVMSEKQDSLQQYVSDMLAVERHMLPAFENQSKDDRFAQYPEARRLVNKIEATIHSHINGIKQHLESLGGDAGSPVKSAVTAALGMAASVIEN